MSARPFKILGLQQIAVGAADKAPLRRLWIELLGLADAGRFKSESENVDEDIAVAGVGPWKVEVDLMQPVDPEKRPRVHDPALNHVGLWVSDLRAAVAWLEQQGVRFTPGGIRKGAPCGVAPSIRRWRGLAVEARRAWRCRAARGDRGPSRHALSVTPLRGRCAQARWCSVTALAGRRRRGRRTYRRPPCTPASSPRSFRAALAGLAPAAALAAEDAGAPTPSVKPGDVIT
jgi:lactoylglutathione lyase